MESSEPFREKKQMWAPVGTIKGLVALMPLPLRMSA